MAESVGVIPEPGRIVIFKDLEFFETNLSPSDKFLIIASDGVWEFITNEDAVNIVVPYWEENNPEGACEQLVKESVIHWQRVRDLSLYSTIGRRGHR